MKLTLTQFEYYKKFCLEFKTLNERVCSRIEQILNCAHQLNPPQNFSDVKFFIDWDNSKIKIENILISNPVFFQGERLDKVIPLTWLYTEFEPILDQDRFGNSILSKLTPEEIDFLKKKGLNL
jgi:hypothetical protein